jgi:predicted ATP-grasp superfamily ATP-dependent carboligase
VETIDSPEIEELSERFLKKIDYYGLVEVEFKKDPRDGQLKLLDVNARTWGFHALGAPAGVDFPYLQYADAVGETVAPSRGKPGMGWLRLVTDIPTASADLFSGHISWKEYWQSLRNTQIESVFSPDDLKPTLAELALLPYIVIKKNII